MVINSLIKTIELRSFSSINLLTIYDIFWWFIFMTKFIDIFFMSCTFISRWFSHLPFGTAVIVLLYVLNWRVRERESRQPWHTSIYSVFCSVGRNSRCGHRTSKKVSIGIETPKGSGQISLKNDMEVSKRTFNKCNPIIIRRSCI